MGRPVNRELSVSLKGPVVPRQCGSTGSPTSSIITHCCKALLQRTANAEDLGTIRSGKSRSSIGLSIRMQPLVENYERSSPEGAKERRYDVNDVIIIVCRFG